MEGCRIGKEFPVEPSLRKLMFHVIQGCGDIVAHWLRHAILPILQCTNDAMGICERLCEFVVQLRVVGYVTVQEQQGARDAIRHIVV